MRVTGLDDNRWSVALDLLADGRGTIQLGDLVSITWWRQGVGARSEIRIDIMSYGNPHSIPLARREREIREGIALVERAAAKHPRLRRLLDTEDVRTQYVFDYGTGSVSIADITPDGAITWREPIKDPESRDRLAE